MSRSSTATASRSSRMALRYVSTAEVVYDWTKRLASLAEALAGIRGRSAVIDGELVFPTADGRPDFYRLQSAKAPRAAERHGLEGIVSKRQASPYTSGPSPATGRS
jgi:ATP-dependent DNA ligase